MITSGTILKTERGRSIHVSDQIGRGGQSEVFRGHDSSGNLVAVKAFTDRARRDSSEARVKRLIELGIAERCKLVVAPHDCSIHAETVVHVSRYVEGCTLEDYIYGNGHASLELAQDLYLGSMAAHCCAILHNDFGLAHADIHLGQFKVRTPAAERPEVALFDLDNFYESGGSKSPMIGHPAYLAPEQRSQWRTTGKCEHSIGSDLGSLTVVLHELIFGRHPASNSAPDSTEFEASMSGETGAWLDDPRNPDRHEGLGGRPTKCVGAVLVRMFRQGLGKDPRKRPTASQWRRACLVAACSVGTCPACGERAVADPHRRRCPRCREAFKPLLLRSVGREVVADRARVGVGRNELGAQSTVSETHCLLRWEPPLTWIEPCGKNGTFVLTASGWLRLDHGVRFPLSAGDRLRLADTEVEVSSERGGS